VSSTETVFKGLSSFRQPCWSIQALFSHLIRPDYYINYYTSAATLTAFLEYCAMEDIDDLIKQADGSAPATSEVEKFKNARGQGIFHVHDVEIRGKDDLWVAKWPNHERRDERRLLFIELIIARLGRLFKPRLTPEFLLAMTADTLRTSCPVKELKICRKPLGEGTAFATHLEDGRASWNRLPAMDGQVGAAILAFQTWTDAGDPQILGARADNSAVSIDHDDYLQSSWEWDGTSAPVITMSASANLEGADQFRDIRLFKEFLSQLGQLPADLIARACGNMPPDWFAPREARLQIARYLLARQPLVEDALLRWIG